MGPYLAVVKVYSEPVFRNDPYQCSVQHLRCQDLDESRVFCKQVKNLNSCVMSLMVNL